MDPKLSPEKEDPDRAKYTAAAALSGCFLLLAIAALVFGLGFFLLFGPNCHGPHY